MLLAVTLTLTGCLAPAAGEPQIQPTAGSFAVGVTPTPATGLIEETPRPTQAGPVRAEGTFIDQAVLLDAITAPSATIPFEADALDIMRVDMLLLDGVMGYSVSIEDKFGNRLASVSGGNEAPGQSIAEVSLPWPGSYRLVAEALSGAGSIRLQASRIATASGGGQFDTDTTQASARFTGAQVYHVYQFLLSEGSPVTISASGARNGEPDTSMSLFGPDGLPVASVDDVEVPDNLDAKLSGYVPGTSGVYTAVVTSAGGTTGDYVFSILPDSVSPVSDLPADILLDQSYGANLAAGSPLSVTFDGQIGTVIRVDLVAAEELDVDLFLYSPFDQIIAYAVASGPGAGEQINEVQLPTSGRYRLELRPSGVDGAASFGVFTQEVASLTGGGVFGDQISGVLPGRFEQPAVFHFYQFNAHAGDRISLSVVSASTDNILDLGFALLTPDGHQLVFADDSEGANPLDPSLQQVPIPQTGTCTVIVYALSDATGLYELSFAREPTP
ncbi:MAG: hypothetical protein IT326_10655 [Anaerolineae bacterium]|nr:hypothetical protein [Anaerolineae bacterium]